MSHDMNVAFTLRVRTHAGNMIVIRAWDDGFSASPNHNRLDVEVRHMGRVIFSRSEMWCGLTSNYCTDSIEAKELVLSLVAMQPGDTDEDYFAAYTEEQLDWVRKYGDLLNLERQIRYCDENGSVRS